MRRRQRGAVQTAERQLKGDDNGKSKGTDKLKLTKIATLVHRRTGEKDPAHRTLHRFCVVELNYRKQYTTVRVDDCDPASDRRGSRAGPSRDEQITRDIEPPPARLTCGAGGQGNRLTVHGTNPCSTPSSCRPPA
jgi:hypothetical protein